MTCKDCLCEIPCKPSKLNDMYADKAENCPYFKNKADFVEVVECCDCKFSHYYKYAFAYSCKRRNYFSEYVRPTDFCSYGVKKEEPTKIEHNSLCETETFESR